MTARGFPLAAAACRAGHPDAGSDHRMAGQAAAECLCRAVQPHRALRLARPPPIRIHRRSPGVCQAVAMDLQPRTAEPGPWRHRPETETGAGRLASAFWRRWREGGITGFLLRAHRFLVEATVAMGFSIPDPTSTLPREPAPCGRCRRAPGTRRP